MNRSLVPFAIVAAMAALAVAALTAGFSPYYPAWWTAAVQLAVLGGIMPMIYAVNIQIVPVFSRRSWPSEAWLKLQVALAVAGAWLTYGGRITGSDVGQILGHGLALAGGITFTINVVRLFRQPIGRTPALPLPYPDQAVVDKLATRFTRLAGLYLLVGLITGFLTSWWRPTTGRWDLVWAHALLVGFFLSMAAGVCYHVLARWTTRRWRWQWSIRLHLMAMVIGLPMMLLALATDWMPLFAVAGPLQAAAIVLFVINLVPMLRGLPVLTGIPVALGSGCLLIGVGLGATFAVEPAVGARLRLVHAELNLFGWTGLLICGVGYYLIPRFLGQPLRWPRLAIIQLGCLVSGVLLGVGALAWRAYGDGSPELVVVAQALVALGFLLFGTFVAVTVRGGQGAGIAALSGSLRLQARGPRGA